MAKAELEKSMHGLRQEDIDGVMAEARAAQARSELTTKSYERLQSNVVIGGVSLDELERAGKQAEQDRATHAALMAKRRAALAGTRSEDIDIAKARLSRAEAGLDLAEAELALTSILSPIDAEILQVKGRPGEYAHAGGAELFVIGDTTKLRARIDINERYATQIRPQMQGFITTSAHQDQRIAIRVVEIGRRMGRKNVRSDDPVSQIDTKILEAVVDLDKASHFLVPGLRVVGFIRTTED